MMKVTFAAMLLCLASARSARAQTTCSDRYDAIVLNTATIRQQVVVERDKRGLVTVAKRDAILAGLDRLAAAESAFKTAGCILPAWMALPVAMRAPLPAVPRVTITTDFDTLYVGQSAVLTITTPTADYVNITVNGDGATDTAAASCTYSTMGAICSVIVSPTASTVYSVSATAADGTPYRPLPGLAITVWGP